MAHSYRVLTDPDEVQRVVVPVLERNGYEVPPKGCAIAAVEFDEQGEVVAFQMLQNAIFAEGLWARDGSAHLRTLGHMVIDYAEKALGVQRMMTMARQDEQGERIGRYAERMGFELMPVRVYRRQSCHS